MTKSESKGDWRRKETGKKGESVLVEFSPLLIERLQGLYGAVSDSKVFDEDILQNLAETLKPEPLTPARAVSEIAHYVREAQRHVSDTNDRSAKYALGNLMEVLSRVEPCVVPAAEHKKSR